MHVLPFFCFRSTKKASSHVQSLRMLWHLVSRDCLMLWLPTLPPYVLLRVLGLVFKDISTPHTRTFIYFWYAIFKIYTLELISLFAFFNYYYYCYYYYFNIHMYLYTNVRGALLLCIGTCEAALSIHGGGSGWHASYAHAEPHVRSGCGQRLRLFSFHTFNSPLHLIFHFFHFFFYSLLSFLPCTCCSYSGECLGLRRYRGCRYTLWHIRKHLHTHLWNQNLSSIATLISSSPSPPSLPARILSSNTC